MLNPNGTIVKFVFLILSWSIVLIPSVFMVKQGFEGFKEEETYSKILNFLSIIPFLFFIFVMTFVCIERLINFTIWSLA